MNPNEESNLKLKVKGQWYCDLCGGIIESDRDGMLEWDSYISDDGKLIAKNFRIVHGRWLKVCVKYRPDDNLADGHLHWYTGSNGLSELLDIATRYVILDYKNFYNIIRRLHVDYYEEGHRYLSEAREDGYQIDPHDTGHINQEDLKWLIRKYG